MSRRRYPHYTPYVVIQNGHVVERASTPREAKRSATAQAAKGGGVVQIGKVIGYTTIEVKDNYR